MALLVPPLFPFPPERHPELAGERLVFDALAAALDDRWLVLHNQTVPGVRRRIDFLIIEPARGVVALEVKGGLVHACRGSFRQTVKGRGTRPGQRKRIDPFAQTGAALDALLAATGIARARLAVHVAAVFPQMCARAFPWGPSPHLLYAEDLAPERLATWCESAIALAAGKTGDADPEAVARLVACLLPAGNR